MVYSPKYSYGNSQGAWELVKLCLFFGFSLVPGGMGVIFLFYVLKLIIS